MTAGPRRMLHRYSPLDTPSLPFAEQVLIVNTAKPGNMPDVLPSHHADPCISVRALLPVSGGAPTCVHTDGRPGTNCTYETPLNR
jgi:hypothetical protein